MGSLRFAGSRVTSHVERDLVETALPAPEPDHAAARMQLFESLVAAAHDGHELYGRIEDLHGTTTGDGPASSVSRRAVLVTSISGGTSRTRAAVVSSAEAVEPASLAVEAEHLPRHSGPLPAHVVFEPMAFAELIAEFAAVALTVNGREDVDRFRRYWEGARIAGPGFTVTDDPAALGGWAVDIEGTASPPLVLVDDGVVTGSVQDRETAAAMGIPPSGRASRDVLGLCAYPANLVIDLPSAPPRGDPHLRVERVHYVSVVDPATGTLTAATRDFTTVVTDGRAVAAVPSIRFTVDVPRLLRNVLGGVGPARTVPVSWGGCVVRTPAVSVADLPLTVSIPHSPNGVHP
ncbi:metallopeptidase TldD-related protein [Allokutzneria sp. A3M-2-11 16]|uniref:metallopeptidase TldD-related protein n=1 Tax=Allokutzneria sp. A3M-2-11 16 TaxID=2962043 RepID=UPI0020B8D636|nr:metallopeptidase TldD-related protein [Allokutzneria sp. A3M-2-11 16]MCP3801925.1 metallopeptidase TldD-related protein [Allokutzneria sp. A3M-2-11 16]